MRIWKIVSRSKHWCRTYICLLLISGCFFSQFASFLEWIRDTSSCSMNTCLLLIIINRMIHVALKQLPVVQLLKSTVIFLCGGENSWKFCCFHRALETWKLEPQCTEKETCCLLNSSIEREYVTSLSSSINDRKHSCNSKRRWWIILTKLCL